MRLMQNEGFVFRPGMAKRADSTKEWKPIPRLAFAFFGLMLVGSGSLTLLSGKLHYRNHWHAPRVRSVRHLEESPNLAQGQ